MKDLKITKGEWIVEGITDSYPKSAIVSVVINDPPNNPFNLEICHVFPKIRNGQREANAALICEAGNVYNETGLTPRDLVKMIVDLSKNVIKEEEREFPALCESGYHDVYNMAVNALSKTTSNHKQTT